MYSGSSMARKFEVAFAAAAFLMGFVSSAYGLCVYHGVLYAKTTLEQEFHDASVVVRADVLSSQEIYEPDTGVLYRVRVEQSFKGNPPAVLVYYTERNSGGFYLETGTQYLLFLNPISATEVVKDLGPRWAKEPSGILVLNYSCGQSRPWGKVAIEERKSLSTLSVQARQVRVDRSIAATENRITWHELQLKIVSKMFRTVLN